MEYLLITPKNEYPMRFLDKAGLQKVWQVIEERFQPLLKSGSNIKTINN